MRIICFTGPKGSGKDTAARYLLNQNPELSFHQIFQQINFADPLKKACGLIFGFTDLEMSDALLKEKVMDRYPHKSPREVLQHVANTMRTLYSPDIWVQAWQRRLPTMEAECLVCTDLRHPEELDLLRQYKAKIVYVENPAVSQAQRDAQLQAKGDLSIHDTSTKLWNDPSESFYPLMRLNSDAVITNDGTITELHQQVDTVAKGFYGDWNSWLTGAKV